MDLVDVATELPPDTLVEFVTRCLDIDDQTIVDVAVPSIQREVYSVGWDRFAICWDLAAKRTILENYIAAKAALDGLDGEASALALYAVRARVQEAGRAFTAISETYRDRYGYGRAKRGLPPKF